MATTDGHDEPDLPLAKNLHDLQHGKEEDRREIEDRHGEIDRMPEEDVDLRKPHVGDMRGPVTPEPTSADARDERRAMDPDIGFKWPPIRPREVQ